MPTIASPEINPDDTRQRIITAAMRLFGELGYTQATTRAIAEAAGVNEVTVFRQFGSKKNLLMACMEAFNAVNFPATFQDHLTGVYADDIAMMAHLQIQDTTANLEVLRILICDARTVPELRQAMLAGGRGNLVRLSTYFQQQIDLGVVRKDIPADVLSVAFDSLFSTNVIFENFFQDSLSTNLPSEEIIRSMVDLFVRGTRAG
jgi:AcrR family transcriptional regulator